MTPLAQTTRPLPVRVDEVLAEFLDAQAAAWADDDLAPMLGALRGFVLHGGKRLRPGFCYWAWHGLAGPGERAAGEQAVVAGAALELFHCFALIHDDLIDDSAERRGRPSVHEEFAAAHTALGWRGEARSHGRNVALLCGDLCALWAGQLLAQCGAPPPRLRQAQQLFGVMAAEAVAGEYLDVVAQASGEAVGAAGVRRVLRVVQLKTARYSIVRPLQLGAVLAGAAPSALAGYAAFGEPLGVAFQLRDDVLGVFGDPARTGKSALDDLRRGTPTVLLALTFARADAGQLAALSELVGQPGLDEAGAQRVRDIMVACGALAATEERIARCQEQAAEALSALEIGAEARDALGKLAAFAVARSG